jgi:hypothetical protein
LIQAITPEDVRHLFLISPEGLEDVRYKRYLQRERTRQENDRLWTLAIVAAGSGNVRVEALQMWAAKYPTAYRLAVEKIEGGIMMLVGGGHEVLTTE